MNMTEYDEFRVGVIQIKLRLVHSTRYGGPFCSWKPKVIPDPVVKSEQNLSPRVLEVIGRLTLTGNNEASCVSVYAPAS